VVTSGTGRNAYTGDSSEWGKTGTTENNGDAWFVGANQDVTVAVWVGHANSVRPMLTEYGGAPVDGGTIPALIFNDVITAVERLKAVEKPGKKPSTSGTSTSGAPTTTSPAVPAPSSPAPRQPSQPQGQGTQGQHGQAPSQPPPSTGGGGGTGGGTGSGGVPG